MQQKHSIISSNRINLSKKLKKKFQHITQKQNYFRNIIDMKLSLLSLQESWNSICPALASIFGQILSETP